MGSRSVQYRSIVTSGLYRSALFLLQSLTVAVIAVVSASGQPSPQVTPRSPFLDPVRESTGNASSKLRWYKGNTHTHTLNSDGDSTPDDVVRWYREHRYQFLVLTDHNFLTSVEALNALHGADEQFLVIRGEEVTTGFQQKPLHVNGLNLNQLVSPQGGMSVADVLQANVDAVRKVGGIPTINHPNFGWAISADDMKKLKRTTLFEVFNGHTGTASLGGGDTPGLEQVWDQILSSGQEIYGIAVDDAHTFKEPWQSAAAVPGRGWVVVRAASLQPQAIVSALDRGEFYSSTGIELEDLLVTSRAMTVTIKRDSWDKGKIQFIGRGGRLLKEAFTTTAIYQFMGDEGYVRARAVDSIGRLAWVQPVFLSMQSSTR
jgi:hypothetical protein